MKRMILIVAALLCAAAGPASKPAAAGKVVFLVDATGSINPLFDNVRKAVNGRIGALTAEQKFNVVRFQDGGVTGAWTGLRAPDADARRVAQKFLDKTEPQGSYGELAALRAAFALKPDEIWFWSDGEITDDFAGLFKLVASLNPTKAVRINTCIVRESRDYRWLLVRLARDSGGICLDEKGNPVALDEAAASPPAKPKRAPRPVEKPKPAPPTDTEGDGVKLK